MRSRGFSLVELAVTLSIIALIGSIFTSMFFSFGDGQRATNTRAKLAAIDAALVSFVAINRRLPCPANGSQNTGTEVFGTQEYPCANQANGVVPWVTLGLSAVDIEDAWGTRVTYRLDQFLARTDGMDMSMCDPAGTGAAKTTGNPAKTTCTVAGGNCTSGALALCVKPIDFLAGKGLAIQDAGGVKVMDPGATPPTGAAYALISHGENRSGGFNDSGVLLASTKGIEGVNETINRADSSSTYYVDSAHVFSSDNTRFDDFVIRPSVISVINRAHLGPRSH